MSVAHRLAIAIPTLYLGALATGMTIEMLNPGFLAKHSAPRTVSTQNVSVDPETAKTKATLDSLCHTFPRFNQQPCYTAKPSHH